MTILITNDDGILAPGLLALVQGLRDLGPLSVLAPDRNWSASGHVKTMHRPLRAWDTHLADGTPALATDAAPSDCVALAVMGLVEDPIDLVVAGINPLANLGDDVTYSGTVTAAMEAAIAGLPGMAVSLHTPDGQHADSDYGPASKVAAAIAKEVLERGLPKGVLLNINVPPGPLEQIRGVAITRQGMRVYRDALIRREDPRGHPYFWIGGSAPTGIPDEGTDFWALENGLVSVTPLHLDLTAHAALPELQRWEIKI
jgi:5'-nucleotidase